MSEFFHMGGYAFHVWTSWGLSALGLATLYGIRRARIKKARKACQALDHDQDHE